ncbi:dihydropteroate synthase [Nocardia sp. CA-120079]|uniref:dihydropteroate synthase n=1 Tax=Nocardia sp. CA-120079 TaxID=3239974 RepID=UPI003D975C42
MPEPVPGVGTAAALRRPDRCAVLGVLNVTPDSFSDGGRYDAVDAAVQHGCAMARAGADYVDVGGESTRPGAGRIGVDEELGRILPVVKALTAACVGVSIDTTRARVAAAAIEHGACLVNDVSGGLADPDMARVVAEAEVPWVLMHWRGHSRRMDERAEYDDVVTEVREALLRRAHAAVAAGVDLQRIVLDPGLGFAKQAPHDLALLAALDEFVALGLPILVGASRKRFLATAMGEPGRPPAERDAATLATSVLASAAGVWGVRVHDVRATVDALGVVSAVSGCRRTNSRLGGCEEWAAATDLRG